MAISCDVLVVGAGPAGLSASIAAATAGAKVICVDKKNEVGSNIKCAEGVAAHLLSLAPFKLPKSVLTWPIAGIQFCVEDFILDRVGGLWNGYTINRCNFEKWLANKATNSGARIITSSELVEIDVNNDLIANACKIKKGNSFFEVLPKTIIACDGAESRTLDLLGVDKSQEVIANVVSWEMKNVSLSTYKMEQIFYGPFSPYGYGYIFPKSKSSANVGVGTCFPNRRLEDYFYEFIETPRVKKQLASATKVIEKSGTAIINREPHLEIGNIIFAGDSANRNLKPFVEGILPAVISGFLAGKIAPTFIPNIEMYKRESISTLKSFYDVSEKVNEAMFEIFKLDQDKRALLLFGFESEWFDLSQLLNLKNKTSDELRTFLSTHKKSI